MIRTSLGLALSLVVLGLAAYVARIQVENYAQAAELDALAVAAEWNACRASGIKPELLRFEFDLEAEQTRDRGRDPIRFSR